MKEPEPFWSRFAQSVRLASRRRARGKGRLGALAVAIGMVALGAPHEAHACINGVELEIMRFQETPTGQIIIAERQLEAGRPASAALMVRNQFARIRELDATAVPLARRALRIYALAVVRNDAKTPWEPGWTVWANQEWAIETLAELARAKSDSAAAKADLAEAQSLLPRTQRLGREALEDLDRRDLLGSPFAYSALAKARRAEGDEGGAVAATRRCAMMSTDKKRCELAKTRPT